MVSPKQIGYALYLTIPILLGVVTFNITAKRHKVEEKRLSVSKSATPTPGAMVLAAQIGNWEEAKQLVTRGGDPNEYDGFGQSLLTMAAGKGNLALLQWLLEHGGDATHENSEGANPLIGAIQSAQGIAGSYFPLQSAYPTKAPQYRHGILANGGIRGAGTPPSTPNVPNPAKTPSRKPFFDCLSLLIAKGARVDSVDTIGRTPLYYASYDAELFLFFWDRGAKWRTLFLNSEVSLFEAAGTGGKRAIVEKLLTCLPQATSEERAAFLTGALIARRKELAELLIQKGCVKGDMSRAVTILTHQHYGEGLQILKREGVSIPKENLQKALDYAVRDGELWDAQVLLEMGISPNFANGFEGTPLTRAISLSDAEMIELLMKHGADARFADTRGRIPLNIVTKKSKRIQSIVLSSMR